MSADYDAVQDSLLRQLTDGLSHAQAHAARRGEGGPPPVPDHELLRLIGGGSYGEVWLARNVLGTYRAVKVVYRSRFSSARPYEREFHGMQSYEPVSRRHEGLVDILQIGRNDEAGFFYYVMELADDTAGGPPLAALPEEVRQAMLEASRPRTRTATNSSSVLETFQEPVVAEVSPQTYEPRTLSSEIRKNGRLAAAECVQAFLTLTAALSALHRRGLLHRDLKPSNIIIVGGVPKLADIGLVAEAGAEMSFVGTEGFIPPEGPGTAAADIYALGKMFYEAFTGLDRQQFPSLPAEREGIPELKTMLELSAVANKACAPEAAKRYESAEEMLADLALLHSGRSVRRLRMVEKRLHRATRFGLAAAVIAVLATGTGFLLQHLRSREHEERNKLAAALIEARLQRAVAERIAAKPGARFSVLETVTEAARTRPGDAGLRSEAITALATPDARLIDIRPPERRTFCSFVWNEDQSLIAVAREDGSVRVEKADGTVLCTVQGGEKQAPLTLGQSGRWMLNDSEDYGSHLWDLGDRKEIFTGNNRPVPVLDPQEKWFVYFGPDWKQWTRRDLATGEEITVPGFLETNQLIRSEIVAGRIACGVRMDRKIHLVNVATMQEAARMELPEGAQLFSLGLDPAGRHVTAGTTEFRNFTFDLSEPKRPPQESRLHHGSVISMRPSPDGEVYFSTAWDNSTRLIHTATGRQLTVLPAWSFGSGFSPDGHRYWRIDAPTFGLHRYEFAPSVCREIPDQPAKLGTQSPGEGVWSPDGRILAVCSWKSVRFHDARTGAFLNAIPLGRAAAGVVFRDDGAVITAGNGIYLWPAASGDHSRIGPPSLLADSAHIWLIRGSRDGRSLAGSFGREMRRFDGTKFVPVEEPVDETGDFRVMEISPDGHWTAAAVAGNFRVWDVKTGQLHWKGTADYAWMPVFSPDSKWMVANDLKGATAYDIGTKTVRWHTPLPESVGIFGAWSPDGRMLVLVRRSDTLAILDAHTGKVWGEWAHPNRQPINCVTFSPDGRHLAVACTTGLIQLWDIAALRRGLKECGLDFPLPEVSPETDDNPPPPLPRLGILSE